MGRTFVVHLRGTSHENVDGTRRQDLLAGCKNGDRLELRAEPENFHDRYAVAVFNTRGQQLGYLPSDARDSSSILRGEPISALALKRIGGPKWWHTLLRKQRSYGLLIQITKGDVDWAAYNKCREVAEQVDTLVKQALQAEKHASSSQTSIELYESAMSAVIKVNRDNPQAAAHRYVSAPINRLTMLLVKEKRIKEAKLVYEAWKSVTDPVGLTKSEEDALNKRMSKLASI